MTHFHCLSGCAVIKLNELWGGKVNQHLQKCTGSAEVPSWVMESQIWITEQTAARIRFTHRITEKQFFRFNHNLYCPYSRLARRRVIIVFQKSPCRLKFILCVVSLRGFAIFLPLNSRTCRVIAVMRHEMKAFIFTSDVLGFQWSGWL